MKKFAIIAALLATTACDGMDTSKEGLTNQASEMGNKARTAAEGLIAQLRGEPDQAKTEQAKAETGETTIGEPVADATEGTAAVEPTAVKPAATELTVEQKVEEARKAVTTLLPVGTYTWTSRIDNAAPSTLVMKPDGSADWSSPSDRIDGMQLRKVGEDMCFELPAGRGIGACFKVSEPDQNGVIMADGTNTHQKALFTPVK